MDKKKINTRGRVSATKAESKKVTNMVEIFLNEDRDSFQVPATQKVSEKVYTTVTTFLNGDSDGFKVQAT